MGAAVTVVVATRNRAGFLPDLFAALTAQEGPEFEVVVADDGSTDDTPVVVEGARRSDDRIRSTRTGGVGPAGARNAAVRLSAADWLAFTDDDCIPQPGWLEALVAAAERTGADVVQGRTVSDPTIDHDSLGWFARGKDIDRWSGRFQMCNLLIRREVFDAAGGIDERFPPHGFGEDTDLGLRIVAADGSTLFAPDAVVHHRMIPMDFLTFLRRRWRWAQVVRVAALSPDGRSTFSRRHVAQLNHIAFWVAIPVSVVSVAAGAPWVPLAGVAGFTVHRATTGRGNGRSLRTRIGRAPLELVGLGVECAGFLVQSVRQRTFML